MAKLGEGNKRWIVSAREDGTNVNSWHWAEKNVTAQWTAELKTALGAVALRGVDVNGGVLDLSCEADSVSGEISLYTRKGRKFPVYELDVKVKWKGVWSKQDEGNNNEDGGDSVEGDKKTTTATVRGRFHLEDVSPDSLDDLQCVVSVSSHKNKDVQHAAKEVARKELALRVRAAVERWGAELDQFAAEAPVTPRGRPSQSSISAMPLEAQPQQPQQPPQERAQPQAQAQPQPPQEQAQKQSLAQPGAASSPTPSPEGKQGGGGGGGEAPKVAAGAGAGPAQPNRAAQALADLDKALRCPSSPVVDLSGVGLSDVQVHTLVTHLLSHPARPELAVHSINLNDNNITEMGARVLVQALAQRGKSNSNPKALLWGVRRISLAGNQVTEVGKMMVDMVAKTGAVEICWVHEDGKQGGGKQDGGGRPEGKEALAPPEDPKVVESAASPAKKCPKSRGGSSSGGSGGGGGGGNKGKQPLCRVGKVFPNSPASECGLQEDDLVFEVGAVGQEPGSFQSLMASVIPQFAANKDKELHMRVRRKGEWFSVTVTPRTWGGGGLLGCMLHPME